MSFNRLRLCPLSPTVCPFSTVFGLSCALFLLSSVSPVFSFSCVLSLLFSVSPVFCPSCVLSLRCSVSPVFCLSCFCLSCVLSLLSSVSPVFFRSCVLSLLCSIPSQFISLFFESLPCSDAPVLVAALPEVLKEDDMSALLSCSVQGEPWPQVNAQIKLRRFM